MEKLNSETNQKTQQEYYDELLFEMRQIKDLLTILVGMEASDREDDGYLICLVRVMQFTNARVGSKRKR